MTASISSPIRAISRHVAFLAALSLTLASPLMAQSENAWDICQRAHLPADQVIAGCNSVIASNGKSGDLAFAYLSRGTSFARRGEFDQAIADFDEALARKPKTAEIFFNRAKAWQGKRDFWRAVNDFDRAIMIDESEARYYNGRGRAFLDKDDTVFAIADFDTAIRLDPKNAAGYANRAEAHARKRDFERALADHDESIRLSPSDSRLYLARAQTFRARGDNDKAIADERRANPSATASKEPVQKAETKPQVKAEVREAYAQQSETTKTATAPVWDKDKDKDWLACRAQGTQIDARMKSCNALIVSGKPKGRDLAEIYSNRGGAYIQKQDYTRAIADLDEAIRIEPEIGFFYGNRAIAFFMKGDRQRAAVDFEEQVRLSPNAARSYSYRAIMFEKNGQREKAIADFTKAAQLEPGRPDAVEGLKRLGAAAPKARPTQARRSSDEDS
jgi:tetratricopeptide (TPR) repeat protein